MSSDASYFVLTRAVRRCAQVLIEKFEHLGHAVAVDVRVEIHRVRPALHSIVFTHDTGVFELFDQKFRLVDRDGRVDRAVQNQSRRVVLRHVRDRRREPIRVWRFVEVLAAHEVV